MNGAKSNWAFFSNNLEVPRGKYRAVEIMQLSWLYGVPAVLWLNSSFDYTVQFNVPSEVFGYEILESGTLPDKYLVIKNKTIYPGNSKEGIKITFRDGEYQ